MKLDTVIFCEDIRNEINNKKSLMGMYNDKIIFRSDDPQKIQLPIIGRLSCFARIEIEKNDPAADTFEFSYIIPWQEIPPVKGPLSLDPNSKFFTLTIIGEGLPLNIGMIGYKITIRSSGKIIKEFVNDKALSIEVGPKETK